ncbi:MAG TPA: helix-turn-helix transcriptional regulator [Mucilaginibacter sp.]|nr:helix-turn-helix transcriptional regulator [Mucilaginibacter sp.]
MASVETIEDFYKHKCNWLPDNLSNDIGHFNVFRLEYFTGPQAAAPIKYSRRDFYKISMVRGHNVYHYGDKSIEIAGAALVFFSPQVPYTVEYLSDERQGCFCIFKESFFTDLFRGHLSDLPMLITGGKSIFALDPQQYEYVSLVFEKMLVEIKSDYKFKYDLLRNYVTELFHYALKMEPAQSLYRHPDANSRITSVFTELLERQFPIESPSQRFTLRSAKDFADRLSVHVNHLNRAIRTTTGKTTTDHIFERLTSEAIALLKHTNWNISEISYCLGFEEPAHFNNFFKKQTDNAPSVYRIV